VAERAFHALFMHRIYEPKKPLKIKGAAGTVSMQFRNGAAAAILK
jgi:hypothetical protein